MRGGLGAFGIELVYGWFKEGFDTSDLQAAQTLLEKLRKDYNNIRGENEGNFYE